MRRGDDGARSRQSDPGTHGAPRHGPLCRDGSAGASCHQDGKQFRNPPRDVGHRTLCPTAIRGGARLVAQGFTQIEGVNYYDTYAPVAKLASFRTILAIAARLDLELHQIDIKGAYLNGELTPQEVIYMRQPPGFAYPNSTGQVFQLIKTIYGLKQSGRRWYQKFTDICEKHLRLTRCSVDQSVFYRREGDFIIVIAVHVDDCTIAASNMSLVEEVKRVLGEHVEVSDLGESHWLLGIEIRRDREAHTISLL